MKKTTKILMLFLFTLLLIAGVNATNTYYSNYALATSDSRNNTNTNFSISFTANDTYGYISNISWYEKENYTAQLIYNCDNNASYDYSSNALTALIQPRSSVVDRRCWFNGSTANFNYQNPSQLQFYNGKFSIVAIINYTNISGTQTIAQKFNNSAGGDGFQFFVSQSGILSFTIFNGTGTTRTATVSGKVLANGTTFCAAATYDNVSMNLYLNGTEKATTLLGIGFKPATLKNFTIGNTATGTINKLMVFNYTLSQAQIIQYCGADQKLVNEETNIGDSYSAYTYFTNGSSAESANHNFSILQSYSLTYYLSPSGSDSNDCISSGTPCKTFSHLLLMDNDTVMWERGGKWSETNVRLSNLRNITFKAYGTGAMPIIDGRKNLTNWNNASWNQLDSTVWNISTINTFVDRLWINGSEQQYSLDPTNSTKLNSSFTWNFNETTYQLKVYSASIPSGNSEMKIVSSAADATLMLENSDYCNFSELNITGARPSLEVYNSSFNEFKNMAIGYWASFGVYISKTQTTPVYSQNNSFSNITFDSGHNFQNTYNTALQDSIKISCGGAYNKVVNSTFLDWGHSTIYPICWTNYAYKYTIGASYNEFYNNTLNDVDLTYGRAYNTDGAYGYCSYNLFHHNRIIEFSSEIQFAGDHNQMYNNLIINVTKTDRKPTANPGGIGMYIYNTNLSCRNNLVENNTIYNIQGSGITLGAGSSSFVSGDNVTGNIVKNNIIYVSIINTSISYASVNPTYYTQNGTRNNTFTNNLFYLLNDVRNEIDYRNNRINTAEFNTYSNYAGFSDTVANNSYSDPQFNLNYLPTWNSEACNMSDSGSYVGALPCSVNLCGNNAVDPGESCDNADLNSETCISKGYLGGNLGCSASCNFNYTNCDTSYPTQSATLTLNFSLLKVLLNGVYGSNTHGYWGSNSSWYDANEDTIPDTRSNYTWHQEKFDEVGITSFRADMGLEKKAWKWLNGNVEDWWYNMYNFSLNAYGTNGNNVVDNANGFFFRSEGGNNGTFFRGTVAHSGSYSLGINCTSNCSALGMHAGFGSYLNPIVLPPGHNYNFTAWVNTNSTDSKIFVQRLDTYALLCSGTVSTPINGWQQLSCNFTLSSPIDAGLQFHYGTGTLGSLNNVTYIDQLEMQQDNVPYTVIQWKNVSVNDNTYDITRDISLVDYACKNNKTIKYIISYMPTFLGDGVNCTTKTRCIAHNASQLGELVVDFINVVNPTGQCNNTIELEFWNEPDSNNSLLTNDWDLAGRARRYATMYNTTYDVIKKAYPSMKIGAPAASDYIYNWNYDIFNRVFELNKSDYISLHRYWGSPKTNPNTYDALRASIDAIKANATSSGYAIPEIDITEWNIWDANTKVNYSQNYTAQLAGGYIAALTDPLPVNLYLYQWQEPNKYSLAGGFNQFPNIFSTVSEPGLDNKLYPPFFVQKNFSKYFPVNTKILRTTTTDSGVISMLANDSGTLRLVVVNLNSYNVNLSIASNYTMSITNSENSSSYVGGLTDTIGSIEPNSVNYYTIQLSEYVPPVVPSARVTANITPLNTLITMLPLLIVGIFISIISLLIIAGTQGERANITALFNGVPLEQVILWLVLIGIIIGAGVIILTQL